MLEILFAHPNFPGQFRRIAPALARLPHTRVYGIGDSSWMSSPDPFPGRVTTIGYEPPAAPDPASVAGLHHYGKPFNDAVRRGEQVVLALTELKRQGLEPDVIVAHPGWGDALFLRDFFPGSRVMGLFEFFYQPRGADVGFDPEFTSSMDDIFRLRAMNATHLVSLDACDVTFAPTAWQRSRFPEVWRERMQVLHEGVDTDRVVPDAQAAITLADGTTLKAGEEVLTFVSRNLEPYRGYHIFMRALPRILKERPNCHVVIVGKDGVSYGRPPRDGVSYRERYFNEVAEHLDPARVHFTGQLPYEQFLKVLQVSRLHVYLTYPFILSWSMLEAMSAGCLLLASATAPVEEVITDGENGLLFPFLRHDLLAERAIEALGNPGAHDELRHNARRTVVERYDFETVSLPAYRELIES